MFIAAGEVESSYIDRLAERQIQQCLKERCRREATGEELYLVDHTSTKVAIHMHLSEAEDRIWSSSCGYSQALIEAGTGDIIKTEPCITINHFLKKLKTISAFCRMLDITPWRKNEDFHRTNFNMFVREQQIRLKRSRMSRGLCQCQRDLWGKRPWSTGKPWKQ